MLNIQEKIKKCKLCGNLPKLIENSIQYGKTNFIIIGESPAKDGWIAIDKNYELVGRLAVRKLFELLNTPARLKDINVPTATIVQPSLNKSI